jgi:hypothetical protein
MKGKQDLIRTFILKDIKGNTLQRSSNLDDIISKSKSIENFKGCVQIEISVLNEDEYHHVQTTTIKEF